MREHSNWFKAIATFTLTTFWCAQAYPSDLPAAMNAARARMTAESRLPVRFANAVPTPLVEALAQSPELRAAITAALNVPGEPREPGCRAEELEEISFVETEREMSAAAASAQRQQEELQLAIPRLRERAAMSRPTFVGPDVPAGTRQDYIASEDEIDAVASVFASERVAIPRSQIVAASKHWKAQSTADMRALELATLTLIIAGAIIGAIKSVVEYLFRHYMFGEELTCLGIVKAAYTGAVLGAAFGALKGVEAIFWVKYVDLGNNYSEALADTIRIICPVLEAVFGWKRGEDAIANAVVTIADFIALVYKALADMVWATAPVRLPAVVFCSAVTSQELRKGDVKSWIRDEFIPAFEEEYGFQFVQAQQQIDDAADQLNTSAEETPFVQGNVELLKADGSDAGQASTSEPLTWRVNLQPNQTRTYVVNVKVFRSGTDYGTVAQQTVAADYPYQSLSVQGTINSSALFSKAGSVEGAHQLKVELVDISQGGTLWLKQPDDTITAIDIDLRANRKPSVSLSCPTVLGLTKCAVFVMDRDNTRPSSLILTVDGVDQNLTSSLPASGVTWSDGYTLNVNVSLAEGLHTVRARASDSQSTTYSGPAKTIRVATIPYLVFPGVTLTNVGVTKRYSVQFRDSIGGIGGEDIYIHSNRLGHLAATNGQPAFRFTTASDGWVTFDYTPMETGQHTLEASVAWTNADCASQCTFELEQTSNTVAPAAPAVPPAPTGVQASAITSTSVRVVWADTSTIENGFEIERKTGAGGAWGIVGYGGRDATSFTDIGVSTNTAYFYRVRAHNAAGYSPYSSEVAVTTCVAPDDFRIDDPYNGETSVPVNTTLEWYTVNRASSYDIYFGTTNPPPLYTSVAADAAMPNTQTISLSNLTAGQLYYWQVKAHASCDASKVSSTAVAQFATLGQPGTVNLIKPANNATGLPTGQVFAWDAVTTQGTTIYDLYLGTTDPPPFHASTSWETQTLVTTLSGNTTYYWKVVAKASKDPSLTNSSATWQFTTGTSSSTTVNLTCTKDGGIRGGAYGNINYGGANTSTTSDAMYFLGSDDGCVFSALNSAAALRAVLQFDLSSIPAGSSITNATLKLPYGGSCYISAPTAPLPIYLDPFMGSWNEYSITWNNRPGVDTNQRTTGSVPISHGSPLSLDLTTLTQRWFSGATANNGMLITLPTWETTRGYVKMFHQKERLGSTAILAVTYAVPCSAPAAPATPSPSSGATNQLSTVNLSWAAVAGSANYNVNFGKTNPPAFHQLVTTNSIQVTALEPNTTYSWRVEALADCDPTLVTSSATWTFTTGACAASPAPVLSAPADGAESQGKNVTLSWQSSSWASSYEILVGTSNPPTTSLATVAGTSYSIAALPATEYFWRVRGIAACNASLTADSPVSSFKTATAPTADAGLSRTILAGASTQIGGTPSASGGTAPYTYAWSIVSNVAGTLSATNTANPTFSSSSVGEARCQLLVTDANGFGAAPSQVAITINPSGALATPANIAGIAQSATSLALSWSGVSGAQSYEVARGPNAASVQSVGIVQGTGFVDPSVSASGVYVYRVRAIGQAGPGPWSAPHLAMAVVFSDDPVTPSQSPVRALNVTQLRSAVNAIRAAAGLGPFAFTDSTLAGASIKAVHFSELRSALDPARVALGVSAATYSRSVIAGLTVSANDLAEIRNAIR